MNIRAEKTAELPSALKDHQVQNGEGYVSVILTDGKRNRFVAYEDGDELEIGIGERSKVNERSFFRLLRKIIREAQAQEIERIALDVSQLSFKAISFSPKQLAETIAREFTVASYEYQDYKKKKKQVVAEVLLLGIAGTTVTDGIKRGQLIGEEVNGARTLANTPGGDMTPALLAKAAEKAAEGTRITVEVLGKEELKKKKMGALLSVGQGSENDPKLIIMEYWGTGKKKSPIVLVGKGVTFDTGGLNIKPTGAIEEMALDMSGGATVIHAIVAAAKLKLKKNIVALIPAAENMVSGGSYRPGDIITSMSGKTIEIGNTDAEGRVILADALTYAEKYKPKLVVDVATLTGAALVALGEHAMAIFSNKESLIPRIQDLGAQVGEQVWPLPFWEEFDGYYDAQFADVANAHKKKWGGTTLGARFLNHFTEDYPWVHIDMAPRMASIKGDELAVGSTGEPTRLLVKIVEKL